MPPNAAYPTTKPPKSSPRSTTPNRAPLSSPSAPCSPPWRAAARFLSAPGPAPSAANSSSKPASAPSTARNMSASAPPRRPSKPPLSAKTSRASSSRPARNPSSKQSGPSVAETSQSPLAGKRIVITRAALQSPELFEKLSSSGAIPILLPLVSFAAPEDYAPLDAALLRWSHFDWVMFTSAYAVQAVVGRAARHGRAITRNSPSIAVVGPATKDKAEKAGFSVDHAARTHVGVALAEELSDQLLGKRVLL